jgi:hypothetical protein
MTTHNGLPVHGYKTQSDEKVALVNGFKQDEERLLRKLEALEIPSHTRDDGVLMVTKPDARWADIARSHFEQGFMALNRAVFQPGRVKLPEDDHNDLDQSLAEEVRAALNDGNS